MKVSTRTRYGLRFLFELAYNYSENQSVYLNAIAKKQNISEKYLSKIALILKGAGILKSQRGVHGGYVLSKKTSELKLKEIIEVLEGETFLLDCIKNKNTCEFQKRCPTYSFWQEFDNIIEDFLNSKKLQDLVDDYKKKIEEKN